MNKLQGTVVFCQIQKPVACYAEDKGTEVKVSIVVDEDQADEFNELFAKQPAKVVKTSDFEKSFKIAPPYPDAKKQFVITLRKNTKLGNGEPVPFRYMPRVLEQVGNTLVDVTNTKLPANGSKGFVSFETYNGKMGDVARLKNVLITDMIEYEGADESEPGSEFGDMLGSSVKPASSAASAPASKPAAKKAKPRVDFEEDDASLPF